MELEQFLLHVVVSLALGLIIGLERQFGQHPAGIRTNALVCLGSAMFVSLSFTEPNGHTRIVGQVVSGIGFIGGGAILREGISVRGMNTAATLWCSAAIGALVGLNYWDFAIVGTVAIVASHFLFRPLAHAIDRYSEGNAETDLLYEVKIVCQRSKEAMIRVHLLEQIKAANLRLQGLALKDGQLADCVEMNVSLFALQHDEKAMNDLVAQLAAQAEVNCVSWGKAH